MTLVATPGHTAGTLSLNFTVKDRRQAGHHRLFRRHGAGRIYKAQPGLDTTSASQAPHGAKAAEAGATVLMTNHSEFDEAYTQKPADQGARPRRAAPL